MAVQDTSARQLSALAKAARHTEFRLRSREALGFLARGLIPGLLSVAVFITYVKLTYNRHDTTYWLLFGTSVGAGLLTLGLVVYAYVRRYPAYMGAIVLDNAHGLHDRITNALSFSDVEQAKRTPLMEAAIEDAVEQAKQVSAAKAAPIPLPRELGAVALLGGMVIGLSLLQWVQITKIPPKATVLREDVGLSPDDIDLFKETLEDLKNKDQTEEAKVALAQFNQLIEDLAKKRLTRAEAFKRLEDIDRKLATLNAEEAKAMAEALKKTSEELKKNSLTKATGKALENKDFKGAEREMKKLAERLRSKKPLSKEEKKRLAEALKKASKAHKEALARLQAKRAAMKASLLNRESKKEKMSAKERRLLNRDKRELEQLDRQIQQKEKAQRQLDRLDRELAQAAADLMKDLGLSAEDLDKGAEDINRMAQEEMSQQEKEELRKRLQELRELLRQNGKGGEQLRKRMRKFAKMARGGGKSGKGGKGGKGGKDQEGQDGQGGKGGKGGKGGNGQDGEWAIGPGGKKIFIPGAGSKPGSGSGSGQGNQPGGQGSQPGGQGDKPGGKSWGNGRGGKVAGNRTGGIKHRTHDVEEDTADNKSGPSVSQTILSSAQGGFVGKDYKKVYTDYRTHAEETMKKEDIPPGYRFYIQRYFQLIRPRE
jgi:hypothetical protein